MHHKCKSHEFPYLLFLLIFSLSFQITGSNTSISTRIINLKQCERRWKNEGRCLQSFWLRFVLFRCVPVRCGSPSQDWWCTHALFVRSSSIHWGSASRNVHIPDEFTQFSAIFSLQRISYFVHKVPGIVQRRRKSEHSGFTLQAPPLATSFW